MPSRLSARQEECLRLTAFLTDKEIAARLGLSEATVKKHVHEACRRLGVNRRKAALALLEAGSLDGRAARPGARFDAEPGMPQPDHQTAGRGGTDPKRPVMGYRPPPSHPAFRIGMLLLSLVLSIVLLKAVADLVAGYAGQAGEIGRAAAPER
ncbi:MAG: helix-turn-helix transcriptional regulator [Brevundimonas sp.]|uniref:helix-turn-helix domain-containing protein n=1 Tax=Brevundimonas sp. TaxID=1871086 RepID=UPI0018572D9A|nr:helix-turn-helix transcriptional regulator [Brevundimonas sp.]MBA4803540.1 helix-turn-helix transcriptional regulator [Brevundimonas sp.]